MTRKKTRSLADKVTIRTGRRKDFKKWRHDNPDQVTSSRRFVAKNSSNANCRRCVSWLASRVARILPFTQTKIRTTRRETAPDAPCFIQH